MELECPKCKAGPKRITTRPFPNGIVQHFCENCEETWKDEIKWPIEVEIPDNVKITLGPSQNLYRGIHHNDLNVKIAFQTAEHARQFALELISHCDSIESNQAPLE